MGACVQAANPQQLELNSIDQIQLYQNKQVILDHSQYIKEQNEEQANLLLQAELEAITKLNRQNQENERIHKQMKDLYDPSQDESSRVMPDLELMSLNIKPQRVDENYQRSPLLFEAENQSNINRASSLKLKSQVSQNEKPKQLVDLLQKKDQLILAQPLPSPPKEINNIQIYDAFDSAEISPLMTPKLEESQISEAVEEDDQPPEQEVANANEEVKEEVQPKQKIEEVNNSHTSEHQTKLDNPIFQEHQEKTISLEDSKLEESLQQEPKEREIKILSSKGEQMVISFAPSQQQLFIKSQHQNEIPYENHKPSLEKAIPLDQDVVKIQNEFVVILLSQLEPLNRIVDLNNCEMLGPYLILDTGDIYVGTWQKGKRHGFGKQIFQNGAYYEGQWLDDFLQGFGRYFFQNGDYYTGEFVHGERKGQGELVYTDGFTYTGGWESNLKSGVGEERLNDTIYKGEFKNGKKDGKGRLQNEKDGSVFEGIFKEGKMSGLGTQTWPDGKRYEGEWKDGVMHGQGEFQWEEGKMYKGEYVQGVRQGYGEYSWPDGRTYKGGWKNGVMHGKGLMIWPDQRLQKGIWHQGKRQFTKDELAQQLKAKNAQKDKSPNKTIDATNKSEKKSKRKSKSKSKEKKK